MKVLCLLAFVAVLAAESGLADVTPCCMPKQWSGNLQETIGEYNQEQDYASIAYANADYFYDSTGNQIGMREFRENATDNTKHHRWIIEKYDMMMKYTIENNTCTKSKLKYKMSPPCIPSDATSFGTHMYPTNIEANVWFFRDMYDYGQTRLTVSKKCMPLTIAHISAGPDYILTTAIYQNVTIGITDPTVFMVPKICETDNASQNDNGHDGTVVEMEMH